MKKYILVLITISFLSCQSRLIQNFKLNNFTSEVINPNLIFEEFGYKNRLTNELVYSIDTNKNYSIQYFNHKFILINEIDSLKNDLYKNKASSLFVPLFNVVIIDMENPTNKYRGKINFENCYSFRIQSIKFFQKKIKLYINEKNKLQCVEFNKF